MGIYLCGKLSENIRCCELILKVLDEISANIRYNALNLWDIFNNLKKSPSYKSLGFICNFHRNGSETFQSSFVNALYSDKSLTDSVRYELLTLADILGKSDIDGQLSAISVSCENFKNILASQRDYYSAKSRLYRSIGVLAGAMLAVLII